MTGEKRKKKKIELGEAIHALGLVSFEQTFSRRYEIQGILGAGGMGYVFKGKHKTLKRVEAIKVPKPELLDDPTLMARFKEEASTLARLSHKNIVHVHTVEIEEDPTKLTYISMEFVAGERLDDFLVNHGDTLLVKDMVSIFRNVAEAIDYFHKENVIHRDIKPENILIENETIIPKMVDFGLARTEDRDINITMEGVSAGYTLAYASPEQVSNEPVGPPTDIYSFAVTLYRCLCREYPYNFTSNMGSVIRAHLMQQPVPIQHRNSLLPSELNEALFPGLAKQPKDRPVTAMQIVLGVEEALRPFLHQKISDFYESTGKRNFQAYIPPADSDPTIPTRMPEDKQRVSQSDSTISKLSGGTEIVEKKAIDSEDSKSSPVTISPTLPPGTILVPSPPATPVSRPVETPRIEPEKPKETKPPVKPKRRGFTTFLNTFLVLLIVVISIFAGAVFVDFAQPGGASWSKPILAFIQNSPAPTPTPAPPRPVVECTPTLTNPTDQLTLPSFEGTLVLSITAQDNCRWEMKVNLESKDAQPWVGLFLKGTQPYGRESISGVATKELVIIALANSASQPRTATLILSNDEGVESTRLKLVQEGAAVTPDSPVAETEAPVSGETTEQSNAQESTTPVAEPVQPSVAASVKKLSAQEAQEKLSLAWKELQPVSMGTSGTPLGALPWALPTSQNAERLLQEVISGGSTEESIAARVALATNHLRTRKKSAEVVARDLQPFDSPAAQWIANLNPEKHGFLLNSKGNMDFATLGTRLASQYGYSSLMIREVKDADFTAYGWFTLLAFVDAEPGSGKTGELKRRPALIRVSQLSTAQPTLEMFLLSLSEKDKRGRAVELQPMSLLHLHNSFYLLGTDSGLYGVTAQEQAPNTISSNSVTRLGRAYDPERLSNDRVVDLARYGLVNVAVALQRNGDASKGEYKLFEFPWDSATKGGAFPVLNQKGGEALGPFNITSLHISQESEISLYHALGTEGTSKELQLLAGRYSKILPLKLKATPLRFAPNRGLKATDFGTLKSLATNSWGSCYLLGTKNRVFNTYSHEAEVGLFGKDAKQSTPGIRAEQIYSDPDGNLLLVGTDALEVWRYDLPERIRR
ncbi:MAG: protein kinase [Candidatus Sumerlaeia bacterium]|nr:protein kinase [Candidatus Sumerlaeia bacterium]